MKERGMSDYGIDVAKSYALIDEHSLTHAPEHY